MLAPHPPIPQTLGHLNTFKQTCNNRELFSLWKLPQIFQSFSKNFQPFIRNFGLLQCQSLYAGWGRLVVDSGTNAETKFTNNSTHESIKIHNHLINPLSEIWSANSPPTSNSFKFSFLQRNLWLNQTNFPSTTAHLPKQASSVSLISVSLRSKLSTLSKPNLVEKKIKSGSSMPHPICRGNGYGFWTDVNR